jgi:hypothetical protein
LSSGCPGNCSAWLTGSSEPKTRAELYEEAKRRDIPGRSKMGRDALARALRS